MPEQANPKLRTAPLPAPVAARPGEYAYAELSVTTNFSFLRGASHPDELVARAADLGYRAIGVTDLNSLAGVVRMHVAAKAAGLKLVVGSKLTFVDHPPLRVWPADRAAYGRLSRLLTLGKRRSGKGECSLSIREFLEYSDCLLAAAVAPDPVPDSFVRLLGDLKAALGQRLSLEVSCLYESDNHTRLENLAWLSRATGVPLLACNDVHYHAPDRRPLQDVLTCIREKCSVQEAGFRLFPNGERYLKSPAQMHALFAAHPQAVRRALEVAEQCSFNLDELRYEYPHELAPAGRTPLQYLADLAWAGAATRYPDGIPPGVRSLIEHELQLIGELKIEAYFLTVYDIVSYARSRGILCQGRGSAANSAVCFCLGVTAVDPARIDVLFERFVSAARNEPPDIDVDFEHEQREEVIQYVYEKYGRDRAGMTAEVITYRGRSAVRDVGKALGLGLDAVDQMARRLDWWDRGTLTAEKIREIGLDPLDRTVRMVVGLSGEMLGFPRHLSQHVGGMVMTSGLLSEIVPVENASMPGRTVIEWDKDDIDALGILKVDLLALGMLTCIAKALALVNDRRASAGSALRTDSPAPGITVRSADPTEIPSAPLELHTIPPEDPAVYDMVSDADTVGVFQIESRAQMTMLPRLRPRCFYDLVIEVAIVRPGPIQGGMVHPYLRRRNGEEPVSYPSAALEKVLSKTLGVPLFQEQAMRVAMVGAGFSAAEADQLRRAMAAWKRNGALETFHRKIIEGMTANGYTSDYAEQCFGMLRGFGEYGFPESHAASFALLVYVSAWIKRHHPAAFCCALLNSQPMGFYAPAQIVRDAAEHGVQIRPVDINASGWDCTLEEAGASTEGPGLIPSPGTPGEGKGAGSSSGADQQNVIPVGSALRTDSPESETSTSSSALHAGAKRRQETPITDNAHRRAAPDPDALRDPGRRGVTTLHEGTSTGAACPGVEGAGANTVLVDSSVPETTVRSADPTSNSSAILPLPALRKAGMRVNSLTGTKKDPHPSPLPEYRERGPEGARRGVNNSAVCTAPSKSTWGRGGPAVRLGLRLVKGLREAHARQIADSRARLSCPFTSIAQFHRATGIPAHAVRRLAEADAFGSLGLSRRQALWQAMALKDSDAPLFDAISDAPAEPAADLPVMPLGSEVMTDYATAGLSLKRHPVSLIREKLAAEKITPADKLPMVPPGRRVKVAGLVLIRQRPATASGVVFITIEDETGVANLIVRPDIFDRYRAAARHSMLLQAEGKVERQGQVIHVLAFRLQDRSELLEGFEARSRDFH